MRIIDKLNQRNRFKVTDIINQMEYLHKIEIMKRTKN